MKLTRIFLTAFAIAVLVSCGNGNGFTITGGIGDMDVEDGMVYLMNTETGAIVDSVGVSDGGFVFKGEVDTPYIAQIVLLNHGYVDMIVEPGEISVDFGNGLVSGTPLNDRVNAIVNTDLQKQMAEANDAMMDYWINNDELEETDSTYDVLSKKAMDLSGRRIDEYVDSLKNVLSSGCDNALGVYAVAGLVEWFTFIKGGSDPLFTVDSFDVLIRNAGGFVANNAYVKTQIKNLRDAEKTSAGHKYVDFDAIDFATGKPTKLSEHIGGKLAIVDFWASWCGPCRNEISQNLIPLAKKYKGRVQVVGVDVWDDIEDHAAMVEELGITYPQIIDTTRTATDLYKISGVPQIMLVAPDGTILARDLFGDEIEKAVKKALK